MASKRMTPAEQCDESVHNSFGVGFHQCDRRWKVERDGKHYCRQHDPLARKAREEARHEQWREESERRTQVWKAQEQYREVNKAIVRVAKDIANNRILWAASTLNEALDRLGLHVQKLREVEAKLNELNVLP